MSQAVSDLPAELARHRVLNSHQSAAFVNLSLPHFRRLYRAKQVPQPIKLSARKLGWRASDLLNWLESKQAASASTKEAA